jgi:hypothetical protein
MTREYLLEKINKILASQGDAEGAHSMEDDLHIEVIKAFAPLWVVEEIKKLSEVDFPRWCA